MAMNAGEARKMLDAAEKARAKQLMINFSYRFSEQSQALKKQVESGILGDVYFASAPSGTAARHARLRRLVRPEGALGRRAAHRPRRASAGPGPLAHGVSQAGVGHGERVQPHRTDCAKRACKKFDVEDLAVGLVKFANGATLEIEASWAANIAERELMETRLLGTKGGLVQRNVREDYEFEAEIYVDHDGALLRREAPLRRCPECRAPTTASSRAFSAR